MQEIKVVGHMPIEEVKLLMEDRCDDCGCVVDNSFGDARYKLEGFTERGSLYVIRVCSRCLEEHLCAN